MIKQKKSATVEETFQEFILVKRASTLSEKTLFGYNQVYHFFLAHNHLDGCESVSIIDERFILNWVVSMQSMELKVSSINNYIGTIRVYLYWLMERGYIQQFKVKLLKGQEPTMRFFTDEEIEVLTKKPDGKENFPQYRTWVVICFVLATGARASTVVNIKVSDIDFEHNEILYRHLKNKSVSIVPLSPALARILREYLNAWSREKDNGYLFCDGAENQCTVSALHQALDTYCSKRGIKSKGMHALRHSFARGYIVNGGNALVLQKLLTHSTLEMTKRYVRLFGDDLKKDFEQFSPLDNLKGRRTYSIKKS